MNPRLASHLLHNWPLALVAVGTLGYLVVVLLGGVFYTNQGSIHRSREPARYWRWVSGFGVLFLASSLVLIGSCLLAS